MPGPARGRNCLRWRLVVQFWYYVHVVFSDTSHPIGFAEVSSCTTGNNLGRPIRKRDLSEVNDMLHVATSDRAVRRHWQLQTRFSADLWPKLLRCQFRNTSRKFEVEV